jgi:hypothetical protein
VLRLTLVLHHTAAQRFRQNYLQSPTGGHVPLRDEPVAINHIVLVGDHSLSQLYVKPSLLASMSPEKPPNVIGHACESKKRPIQAPPFRLVPDKSHQQIANILTNVLQGPERTIYR